MIRKKNTFLLFNRKKLSAFLIALAVFISVLACAPLKRMQVISNNNEEVRLVVLMYHSILDDDKRAGDYVITPSLFESDLKLIKEKGFTPITSYELCDFVENNAPLPDKPVIITFDDGYYNNYTYAYPLLKKYNMKGVLSVVGKYSDEYSKENAVFNNNYSHASHTQLKEMYDSKVFELANHSYNMHDMSKRRGILKHKGEDSGFYKELLNQDISRCNDLIKSVTEKLPIAFTYPFGCINNESKEYVESFGFCVTYGCEEGINTITRDKSTLKNIKRYNRTFKKDLAKILDEV